MAREDRRRSSRRRSRSPPSQYHHRREHYSRPSSSSSRSHRSSNVDELPPHKKAKPTRSSSGRSPEKHHPHQPDHDRPRVTEKNGEISCSIEETNRLRLSLGLKPLQLEKKKSTVVDLSQTTQEREQAQAQAEIQKRVRLSKQKRELAACLPGQSISQTLATSPVLSAADWVAKIRTAKPVEAKPAKELTNVSSYTSQDLAGLGMSHDVHELEAGEDTILTLKDTSILDASGNELNIEDDQDQLENVNLAQEKTHHSSQEQSQSSRGYDVYAQMSGTTKPSILSQYDEEEERASKLFLGKAGEIQSSTTTTTTNPINPVPSISVNTKSRSQKTMADYYTAAETVAFQRPKKKKLRKKKKMETLEADDMVEDTPSVKKQPMSSDPTLARDSTKSRIQRLLQRKKNPSSWPAASAYPVTQTIGDPDETKKPEEVIFNDETDFESRLQSAIDIRRAEQEKKRAEIMTKSAIHPSIESPALSKEPSLSSDTTVPKHPDTTTTITTMEEQPLVAQGLAATLALLRQTGELSKESMSNNPKQAGRANDTRERHESAVIRDGVKLDYHDEFGRVLTKKEAFRQLSYKFHGQKPGKKKQEKRLRQFKDELRMNKLLSGEGASQTMKALEQRQQAAGQAHMVLNQNK